MQIEAGPDAEKYIWCPAWVRKVHGTGVEEEINHIASEPDVAGSTMQVEGQGEYLEVQYGKKLDESALDENGREKQQGAHSEVRLSEVVPSVEVWSVRPYK